MLGRVISAVRIYIYLIKFRRLEEILLPFLFGSALRNTFLAHRSKHFRLHMLLSIRLFLSHIAAMEKIGIKVGSSIENFLLSEISSKCKILSRSEYYIK